MEDAPKRGDRRLRRVYECHRLEDQLWDLAYEELWPQIRRALTRQKPGRLPGVRGSEADLELAMKKGA